MASSSNSAAAAPLPAMDPRLLMAARRGDSKLLSDLLALGEGPAVPATAATTLVVVDVVEATTAAAPSRPNGAGGCRQPASESMDSTLLEGVTSRGDSALHVVAAASPQGDDDDLLQCATLICSRAKHLLVDRLNNDGDTPLHCAVRAGNVRMVSHLIFLAAVAARALLRKQNARKETVLHEAVRFAKEDMVEVLMSTDPELARVPDVGTSPMYLAISLGRVEIAKLLHRKDGDLSYSGPHGQNALHAAVLHGKDLTKMVLGWNKELAKHADQFGHTPLHFSASMKHSVMEMVFGSSFWFSFSWRMYGTIELLLDANESAAYQPDKNGSFPIHVAASMGWLEVVKTLLSKRGISCANLRDNKGRTFLHVAVEKKRHNIVAFACRKPWLAPILNMQDYEMYTALHLAVIVGDLKSFASLMRNQKVCLNMANNKGQTPLDLSESAINHSGFHYGSNARGWIHRILILTSVEGSMSKTNDFEKNHIPVLDERKESKKLTDSTQVLGIGSVLIITMTFAVAFALPGGYRDSDHANPGTPTLSGRYAFNAFVISNTLAFICSGLATFSLMYSGIVSVDFGIRSKHFDASIILLKSSVRSVGAAFVLGLYVVLSPVADEKTAIAVCVITSAALLYGGVEIINFLAQGKALHLRLGCRVWIGLGTMIMANLLLEYWSFVIIFGLPFYLKF